LIAEQLRDVAVGYADYNGICSRPVSADVCSEMLRLEMPDLSGNDDRMEETINEHAIYRAALQVAASRLVGQDRQRDNALLGLHRALNLRDERPTSRERQRRKEARPRKPSKR
jgi:hypothetical protein